MRFVNIAAEGIVFTVGSKYHRHAQALCFRTRLQVVQSVGDGDWRPVQVEQLAGQRIFLHHIAGVIQLCVHAEQQAHFFFRCHLADQVCHAGVGIHAPVFISIQLSVLVQILELQAVRLQDGGHVLDVGQFLLAGGFIRLNNGKSAVGLEEGFLSRTGFLVNALCADLHDLVRADRSVGFVLALGAAGAF